MTAMERGTKRKEEKGNGREEEEKIGKDRGRKGEGRVLAILSFKTLPPASLGIVVPRSYLSPDSFFLPTPQSNFLFPVF